ncbi:MAG: hypothetical protein ACRDYX_11590 [Egibacteraceae bacterium]
MLIVPAVFGQGLTGWRPGPLERDELRGRVLRGSLFVRRARQRRRRRESSPQSLDT